MEIEPNNTQLASIFYPTAAAHIREFAARGSRFVHYTSAEAALGILTGQEWWLRNAKVMNDFMEVEYALECLDVALVNTTGVRLKQNLEAICPNICERLQPEWDHWRDLWRSDTYITSVAEHADHEDQHGRLSMWRAYGRVALVLRPEPFLTPTHLIDAVASPVAYLNKAMFQDRMQAINVGLEVHRELLKALPFETLRGWVFGMFRFAVLCTKHPGFAEEREWRLLYSPEFGDGRHIRVDRCIVGGVPQRVCKVDLASLASAGLEGVRIPKLVDRVILGPTEYPEVMKQAFLDAMTEAVQRDNQRESQRQSG